jgi:hypothetical protein
MLTLASAVRRLLLLALAFAISPAFATHIPSSSTPVQYDGSLTSGTPVTGTIGWSTPNDGYDWYCFAAPTTSAISFAATRTSGDILLNLQVYSGTTNSGSPVSSLGGYVGGTSNSTTPDVTFNLATPTAGATYSIAVSTWDLENGGDYSLTMTGGVPTTCAGFVPAASIPVPTLSPLSIALIALLVAAAGLLTFRRIRGQ